jgi:hypothetical protein
MNNQVSLESFTKDLTTLPVGQGRNTLGQVATINAWGHERRVHHLKIWPMYFEAVLDGRKPFELRKDDREFKVGEFLCLWEFELGDQGDGEYSDRAILAAVPYILEGAPGFGLSDGFVIMTIKVVANRILGS